MILSALDWTIIAGYLILSIIVGLWSSKKSSQDTRSFFLAGNNLPWWMLGISMVATTFSTDTPNLVTDLVRKDGVAGNWVWWGFLLTGMLSVFVYGYCYNFDCCLLLCAVYLICSRHAFDCGSMLNND